MRSISIIAKAGLVVTAAAASLLVLAGCSSVGEQGESGAPTVETIVVDYFGHPLNCVKWNGSHGEQGKTCDFVEYHEKFGFAQK